MVQQIKPYYIDLRIKVRGLPRIFYTPVARLVRGLFERHDTHRNEQALLLVLRPHPDVYATL
ncbi:hypothetical protein BIZ35_01735 [Heyndrickxia coagulans]|nr:hypothetical protein BIZ35_01735 [Heyndrickxia coagulans]WNE62516.1 hypothetical protein KIY57_05265 [Heyndrickxia coagulans]